MRGRAAALILLLALSSPVAGQDEPDCKDPQSQHAMNYCSQKDFEKADAELNAIWKTARETARDLDNEQEKDLKGAEKALLAAQRGWIAYRDGHCIVAGFEARGGSMESMLVTGCMADLTRKRVKELKELIER